MQRIEIEVESSMPGSGEASPFHILIPVKSIINSGSITVMLATLTTNKYYGKYKSYSTILRTSSKLWQFATTPSAVALAVDPGITSMNYVMNFTSAGRRVGSTATNPPAKI